MNTTYTRAEDALDPEIAHYWMGEAFRRGASLIDALVAEMGGWDTLPARFEIGGKPWQEAEDAISDAAYAGRWWETIALADDYLRRVAAFCDGWRTLAKAKGAAK